MSASFADIGDLESRWRPLSSAEQEVAATLLGDASARVRARIPGIDATLASGGLDSALVAMVVVGMVKRAMIGADGVTQQSQTAGPFSVTAQYANPLGNLYLTADDLLILEGGRPVRARSVWLA